MKYRCLVSVSAVSSHIPGPLQDREPRDSVSKRAVSRRRLPQSYLKFIPRFQVRICILISAPRRWSRGKSRTAPRANYKLRTSLIPRPSYRHHLAHPRPRPPRLRTFPRGFDH